MQRCIDADRAPGREQMAFDECPSDLGGCRGSGRSFRRRRRRRLHYDLTGRLFHARRSAGEASGGCHAAADTHHQEED